MDRTCAWGKVGDVMRLKWFLAALAIALYCGAEVRANATSYNPITWTVSGTFDDSTTFSGTFSLNSDGYLTDVTSITTNPGTLTGQTYVTADVGAGGVIPSSPPINGFTLTLYVPVSDPTSAETLQLVFLNSLETPGSDPIVGGFGGPSYECYAFTCPGTDGVDTRFVASATAISSTPLPATLPLMATALGLCCMIARVRRRVKRQALA
jgi:hypothetical protein